MSNTLNKQELTSSWIYNGKEVEDSEIPEKALGFIYRIKHIDGRYYIGRKTLYSTKTKQVKGKKKKIKVSSDWKEYWSSSEELKKWVGEVGEDKFVREILMFTDSAAQILYAEECALYHTNAILDDNCLNSNIRAKIFRKWFEAEKNNEFKANLMALKLSL